MKRILLPAGGAVLATGLLAAGLAGTAQANPDWAYDTMVKDAPEAVAVANWWLEKNGEANRLAEAKPYSWEHAAAPKMTVGGGYSPDGKPGAVVPIGEEKKSTSVVKNINLPKTIGKVFFNTADGPRWCSATSIQAKYRNLVATAGHCVYDTDGNRTVMDQWVFVPGYYQGKTPFGVYVGKTAWAHYDFAVTEDFDRDYAFVTVYDGIQVGGGKQVSKAEYDAHKGIKGVDKVVKKVTRDEYIAWVGKTGQTGEVKDAVSSQTAGPDTKGAIYEPKEVKEAEYNAANRPDVSVIKPGAKAYTDTVVITKEAHDAYKAVQTSATKANKDAAAKFFGENESYKGTVKADGTNWTLTRYYVKAWTVPGAEAEYYTIDYVYFIDVVRNVGRLGDNVGGQGFAWNQKTGQKVFVFGYPASTHKDGHKAYTGVTPKWCYGATTGKTYTHAATKVEEHVGLKCAMTPGADGSPWLIKYSNAKRLGYVNGVTSLFGDQDSNNRYDLSTSAYFDGEAAAIYQKAANSWSGTLKF